MADASNPLNRFPQIAAQWSEGTPEQKAAVDNGTLAILIAAEHIGNEIRAAAVQALVESPSA